MGQEGKKCSYYLAIYWLGPSKGGWMRRTTEKIKTQIHLVMTDSETLAYAHWKHLLLDTFIGLFSNGGFRFNSKLQCRKCIIGVHCAMMQTMSAWGRWSGCWTSTWEGIGRWVGLVVPAMQSRRRILLHGQTRCKQWRKRCVHESADEGSAEKTEKQAELLKTGWPCWSLAACYPVSWQILVPNVNQIEEKSEYQYMLQGQASAWCGMVLIWKQNPASMLVKYTFFNKPDQTNHINLAICVLIDLILNICIITNRAFFGTIFGHWSRSGPSPEIATFSEALHSRPAHSSY